MPLFRSFPSGSSEAIPTTLLLKPVSCLPRFSSALRVSVSTGSVRVYEVLVVEVVFGDVGD